MSRRRRFRSRIGRPLSYLFKQYVGSRTWSKAQRTGRRFGAAAWRLGRRDRQRALAHLAIAFPELSDRDRERLAREAALQLGMTMTEFLHLAHRGPEAAFEHFDIDGWEHVEAASRDASVVLIATGHCGNWELLGPAFYRQQKTLTAIVRALDEDWTEADLTRYRSQLGSKVITRGEAGAARDLLRLRREGGFLAAFVDQDIRANSVFVPFFGRPAHTPVGPAQMALRWSMPVVPAFCERLETGRHLVRFLPRLDPIEDKVELTAEITRTIEAQIRKRPEQWVWLHRRWRRQPPEQPSE